MIVGKMPLLGTKSGHKTYLYQLLGLFLSLDIYPFIHLFCFASCARVAACLLPLVCENVRRKLPQTTVNEAHSQSKIRHQAI